MDTFKKWFLISIRAVVIGLAVAGLAHSYSLYKAETTGVITFRGQTYHMIPWEKNTP